MELNVKKVQKMNSEEIYNSLLPTINSIYKSFEYLEISNKEYYNIVIEEINKSKVEYKGNIAYSNYLSKRIRIILSQKTEQCFQDNSSTYTLINNYINKKFNDVIDCSQAIKYFQKIDTFLNTYNYIISPDLIIELIKNNATFDKMIGLIFKQYSLEIKSGTVEKVFNINTLILSIESYCMLNNIEIKEEAYEEDVHIKYDDDVKIYLREIGKIPLLNPKQEKTLAYKIRDGDEKSKEIFAQSNLKLVVSIARRYQNRGMQFLDLIQEGNLGLMTAIERYDVTLGYKFSTYATHWIRQSIRRALADKSRNIRIPVNLYEKVNSYKKVYEELKIEFEREPKLEEVANKMNLQIDEVKKLYKLQSDTISMNMVVGDDKDTEFGEFLPSSEESIEETTIINMMSTDVERFLDSCNFKDRERIVLIKRFGLDGNDPMTLEEVGQIFNVTRERIRQIEAKALRKLRNSKYAKSYAVYMQNPEQALRNLEKYREEYRKSATSTKSYLKDQKESEENKQMPKLQTIYEFFSEYTREKVDEAISKLTDEEKELLTIRYGNDLDHPIKIKLTDDQRYEFYGKLIPKIKRYLKNPNCKRRSRTTKVQEPQQVKAQVSETIKAVPLQTNKITIPNNIKQEDYDRILELLRSETFKPVMDMLTPQERTIMLLKLGYVSKEYSSNEYIAESLGITPLEVIEKTKKILLSYKQYLNDCMDNIISLETKQNQLTFTKK